MSLPNDPHDIAIWLLDELKEVRNVEDHWEGVLPPKYDFAETVQEIPESLLRGYNTAGRRIEFRPGAVGVFQNIFDFLKGSNLRRAPVVFTIRELNFTFGKSDQIPTIIENYLGAVKLWDNLFKFSDYAKDKGTELFFIKSFESQVWITSDYTKEDLVTLPDIDEFINQFFEDKHHRDQKRNIVRTALLEIFKDRRRAKFSDLLKVYGDLVDRVKSSYALYTNDFSFERLKSEVSKQNQEDTLRINKTISDIQNQLLSVPAALIAAGASMKIGDIAVNLTILVSVFIYSWFMHYLINNQINSVDAIGAEIELRKRKVEAQPSEISSDVLPLFNSLSERVTKQRNVLKQVRWAVWGVAVITVLLFGYHHCFATPDQDPFFGQILARAWLST
ncbi:hypothetical protein [Comamonas thiooxydans]|uniref:hypothetical protein n=1 Tax=Comamonas thiooxydans TaxID=363952 RepID=UPI000B0C77B9|nr:hypothetical protein [Comamonas thiooxydans]